VALLVGFLCTLVLVADLADGCGLYVVACGLLIISLKNKTEKSFVFFQHIFYDGKNN
jgi:hypothetical protein